MNFKKPPVLKIWLAFAAVYIIWGSTYFFIELVVRHVAPMLFGAFRFLTAGLMLLIWMIMKKEKIWNKTTVLAAAISGCLMLFVGNGSVIFAEQYLVSSFVAIFMASAPMWFLLLDKPKWAENFRNKFTLSGVLMGMVGVVFLFYEKVSDSHQGETPIWPLFAILVGNIGWVLGSLYSKYKTNAASPPVNSAWQMLSAGIVFLLFGLVNRDFQQVDWAAIPLMAWLSIIYLIIFGSIIGYSAYVFLLKVCSATQVSSYAYVNPLVAVLLGVFINNDHLTLLQVAGLVIILCSVFFINLSRKERMKIQAKMAQEN